MLTTSQKIEYFLESSFRYFSKVKCPNCDSVKCVLIDSKYIVTRLFECSDCHLCFRHPVEKNSVNEKFYQDDYKESDSITATLPDKDSLKNLIAEGFKTGNKNADRYIKLFKTLFKEGKKPNIVDYGSSWGYISYQIKNAGYSLQSFEISKTRAAYGNQNLGLDIRTNEKELKEGVDIFFSSHVIEHHPDLRGMLDLAAKLLSPGGYFIALSPNGSASFRDKYFQSVFYLIILFSRLILKIN